MGEHSTAGHATAGVADRMLGWAAAGTGLLVGTVTALVALSYLVCAGAMLAVLAAAPRPRRAARRLIMTGAQWLARLECARLARFLRTESASGYSGRRAVEYLAVRSVVGLLGGCVLFLLAWGSVTAAAVAWAWSRGESPDGVPATWPIVLYAVVLGSVLLFLHLQGIAGVAALERRLAARFLGPSAEELLERRIAELSASRAAVVEAVTDERRRIERDLHDGVQQRLVALGMLLGRARRARGDQDRRRIDDLLRQAHEEAQQALRDLREVAWRVYPPALDEGGLSAALEAVADRSAVPVRIRYEAGERPPSAVETVVYFVVCEAVTNAAKHAAAELITVSITRSASAQDGETVIVRVCDDGAGGADPHGGGLAGLARRVAALDGRFHVDSPSGGPTTIIAELPCG